MNIKLLNNNKWFKLPEYKTEGAAAMDLYSNERINILPGGIAICNTGLFMEIPVGWKGVIDSRSGLASQGIVVGNAPGTIDSDYRGEIKVILVNHSPTDFTIEAGARIAQFSIEPVYKATFEFVDALSVTARGEGGFGHTGK